jgi:hypothetical protein
MLATSRSRGERNTVVLALGAVGSVSGDVEDGALDGHEGWFGWISPYTFIAVVSVRECSLEQRSVPSHSLSSS